MKAAEAGRPVPAQVCEAVTVCEAALVQSSCAADERLEAMRRSWWPYGAGSGGGKKAGSGASRAGPCVASLCRVALEVYGQRKQRLEAYKRTPRVGKGFGVSFHSSVGEDQTLVFFGKHLVGAVEITPVAFFCSFHFCYVVEIDPGAIVLSISFVLFSSFRFQRSIRFTQRRNMEVGLDI
ncbi:hypothetical protein Taro_020998 [Colocasia esculenta]|uniref:Uncharacterized protein n=1 Tax=Colocasia esculenta TaxID=4460 RepID=A0A843UXT4_COLES|nr:hypothetical protein [Colocasia esculenta]